jgi:hypothetical protein
MGGRFERVGCEFVAQPGSEKRTFLAPLAQETGAPGWSVGAVPLPDTPGDWQVKPWVLTHGAPGAHFTFVVLMAERTDFTTCLPAAQLSTVASKAKVVRPSAKPGAEQARVASLLALVALECGVVTAMIVPIVTTAIAPAPPCKVGGMIFSTGRVAWIYKRTALRRGRSRVPATSTSSFGHGVPAASREV